MDGEILAEGKLRIVAVRLANGTEPAVEFLKSLKDADRAKAIRMMQRLAEGRRLSKEDFKKLKPSDIWELKDYQTRLLCFTNPRGYAVTHGFRKKKNRTPPAQIRRAESIKREYELAQKN